MRISELKPKEISVYLKNPQTLANLDSKTFKALVQKAKIEVAGFLSQIAKALGDATCPFNDKQIKALHEVTGDEIGPAFASVVYSNSTAPKYVPEQSEIPKMINRAVTGLKVKIAEALITINDPRLIREAYKAMDKDSEGNTWIRKDHILLPLLKQHNWDSEKVLKLLNPKEPKSAIQLLAEVLRENKRGDAAEDFLAKHETNPKRSSGARVNKLGRTKGRRGASSSPALDGTSLHTYRTQAPTYRASSGGSYS